MRTNQNPATLRFQLRRTAVLLPLALPLVAAAQVQTSALQNEAQRLQRYYEEQQLPAEQAPVDPVQQPAQGDRPSVVAGDPQAQFLLKRVAFTPSSLLAADLLDETVQPYIGREVSSHDLAELLDKVNGLYSARKITTARALFTSQPVVDGVVHVELVEGRLGKVDVRGTQRLDEAFVRRRIKQQEGAVVDADQLRDNLVFLNRTTDLQVRALLQPGSERGMTDIVLDVTEPARYSIGAFMDNSGIDSTGRFRTGVQGHLFGLAGKGDRLDGNIAHSRGGNDGSVAYSIPLTANNGRLAVSYARSQINIINGAFRDLDITGRSSVASLGYTQPLIATMNWLFSGVGQFSVGDSSTAISGAHIADTRTRQITMGASLQHQKDGQRWSVTQLVTRIHSNEPMLGKSNFTVMPGNAFIVQRLGQSQWAVRADAGWQFSAGKNLPSANLFQIGGLGSVRGYERGAISGPRGYYLDLELHRTIGQNLDAYGFVDHGTIYSFYPTNKTISGAGLGMLYRHGSWLTLSAAVGKPFETVIPGQDSIRADLRLAVQWQ